MGIKGEIGMIESHVVLIPAYKPGENLIPLVEELGQHFATVVVVDDGGGEAFRSIFDRLSAFDFCRVLTHEVNKGKGAALKTGLGYVFKKLPESVVGAITVDADGQHKVKDVVRISECMDENPNALVLGCREFSDKTIPLRSRFGNTVSRYMYAWMCGVKVSDTQTGLRGIPRDFMRICLDVEGNAYEYETNMLIAARENKVPFSEIAIETVYEGKNESSHFNPIKDSIKIYAILFRYAFASIASMLLDYLLFGILTFFGLSIIASTYAARVCSAVFNFALNRRVVFKSEGNVVKQTVQYALLAFVSGTASGILVTIFTGLLGIDRILVKIVVDTLLFFVNYYVQRVFIFTKNKK
jgi:putative flippase GtrA